MSKVKEKHSDFGSLFGQIWRQSGWLFLLLLVLCVAPFVLCAAPDGFSERLKGMGSSLYKLLCLTIFLLLIIKICRSLTDYFSLKRNENGITWCQISILIVIFLWGIAFLLIFDIHKESSNFLVLGIVGTLLGWIFQDTIKGVVAFIHLRLNHLLCIDDWIVVPKHNVDGVVKHITLTTVTVYNWDTTTSSIPTSVLHTDHFINYEKMSRGKTYGRQMLKSFIIDTSCFHPLSLEEAESLRKSGHTQMTLDLEGKKYNVLLKELHYDAAKHQIVEMDFQELVKGEVIHATAEVVLKNREAVTEGVLEQLVSEVAYKAKSEDVVEKVEIDCGSLRLGDTVTVADLAISKNKKVEVTSRPNQVVVEVIAAKNRVAETEEEEDSAQAAS